MSTAAIDGGRNFVIRNAEPAGFIFVLPNHPSKTSGNTDAAAAARVWERPADVSAVLGEVKVQLDSLPVYQLEPGVDDGFFGWRVDGHVDCRLMHISAGDCARTRFFCGGINVALT